MRTLMMVSLVSLFAGCASTKSAEVAPTHAATAAAVEAPLKAPGEAAMGDRTSCPVSGETFTVAADSPKVEYEGKTYYFCCEDCVGEFQKDPSKYANLPAAQ